MSISHLSVYSSIHHTDCNLSSPTISLFIHPIVHRSFRQFVLYLFHNFPVYSSPNSLLSASLFCPSHSLSIYSSTNSSFRSTNLFRPSRRLSNYSSTQFLTSTIYHTVMVVFRPICSVRFFYRNKLQINLDSLANPKLQLQINTKRHSWTSTLEI